MRDDVRKLVGGYATGSLTEAERKLLFEAALDDQELFEELAREHALKELLEEPGAKQRLIAALEKPQSKPEHAGWWSRPWPWAVAATGIASVLVAIALLRPADKRSQIAAVIQPIPQAAPARDSAPRAPESPKTTSSFGSRTAKTAPAPELSDARAETKAEESKDEKKAEAAQVEVAAAPQQLRELVASKDIQTNQAVSGALGGAAPAEAARMRAAEVVAQKAPRFAFDYSLDAERRLKITPAADGYLSVEIISGDEAELLAGIGQNGRVQAGAAVTVQVPGYANAVSIRFGAAPGRRPGETLSRLDALSGTVEDPNPSPESRLSIQLRLPARK